MELLIGHTKFSASDGPTQPSPHTYAFHNIVALVALKRAFSAGF